MKKLFADRIEGLAQSDIRRMSLECARVNGINLDELRHRIARKVREYNGIPCDPNGEVIVNVGSTGSFVTACMALINPGDEVILFSPFYGYHLNILKVCQASLKYVTLRPPDWSYDPRALEAAFSDRTKFILVNTPSNPCGKVFTRDELTQIADLCKKHDALCVTDEIYEYILYDGRRHVSPGSLPGMADRTITISGFSKTYAMTGWRLGYTVAPRPFAEKLAILNDLINICAPSPLQHGVVAAFDLPESYYTDMRRDYQVKRDMTVEACREAGMTPYPPQGAYYMLADFSELGFKDDQEAARVILERSGVAVIPGSSFYLDPQDGRRQIRLCYAKKMPDLEEACRRIRALKTVLA